MINIKIFQFNPFQENTILLWDSTGEGAAIDPSFYDEKEKAEFENFVESNSIRLKKIMITHGHFDHLYGVAYLCRKYGLKACMCPLDRPLLENANKMCAPFGMKTPDTDFEIEPVYEGDTIAFGDAVFRVIETPGHSEGGVCYHCEADKVLVSGDTLFAGCIGRTDLPGGDYDKLIVSVMDKLMGFDADTDILPGHGPKSDIGHERTHNPFLQPFNEPEEELNWDEDGIALDGQQ